MSDRKNEKVFFFVFFFEGLCNAIPHVPIQTHIKLNFTRFSITDSDFNPELS